MKRQLAVFTLAFLILATTVESFSFFTTEADVIAMLEKKNTADAIGYIKKYPAALSNQKLSLALDKAIEDNVNLVNADNEFRQIWTKSKGVEVEIGAVVSAFSASQSIMAVRGNGGKGNAIVFITSQVPGISIAGDATAVLSNGMVLNPKAMGVGDAGLLKVVDGKYRVENMVVSDIPPSNAKNPLIVSLGPNSEITEGGMQVQPTKGPVDVQLLENGKFRAGAGAFISLSNPKTKQQEGMTLRASAEFWSSGIRMENGQERPPILYLAPTKSTTVLGPHGAKFTDALLSMTFGDSGRLQVFQEGGHSRLIGGSPLELHTQSSRVDVFSKDQLQVRTLIGQGIINEEGLITSISGSVSVFERPDAQARYRERARFETDGILLQVALQGSTCGTKQNCVEYKDGKILAGVIETGAAREKEIRMVVLDNPSPIQFAGIRGEGKVRLEIADTDMKIRTQYLLKANGDGVIGNWPPSIGTIIESYYERDGQTVFVRHSSKGSTGFAWVLDKWQDASIDASPLGVVKTLFQGVLTHDLGELERTFSERLGRPIRWEQLEVYDPIDDRWYKLGQITEEKRNILVNQIVQIPWTDTVNGDRIIQTQTGEVRIADGNVVVLGTKQYKWVNQEWYQLVKGRWVATEGLHELLDDPKVYSEIDPKTMRSRIQVFSFSPEQLSKVVLENREEFNRYLRAIAGEIPEFGNPMEEGKPLIISSPPGPRGKGFHPGVDIVASAGTPLKASISGTLEFAGCETDYGCHAKIIGTGIYEGFKVTYSHMLTSAYNKVLKEYQEKYANVIGRAAYTQKTFDVELNAKVGEVGCTGHCSGNHLHYEVFYREIKIDPILVLPSAKVSFTEKERATRYANFIATQLRKNCFPKIYC